MNTKSAENVSKVTGDFANIELVVEQRAIEESHKKKVRTLAIGIPTAIIVIFYVSMTIFYATHFQKNTVINGIVCENMSVEQAAAALSSASTDYTLELKGRNPKNEKEEMVIGTITGKDIALNVRDYKTIAKNFFKKQIAPLWFVSYFGVKHDYDTRTGTSFDADALEQCLLSMDAFNMGNIVMPVDAYISEYDEESHSFKIMDELKGTWINNEKTISLAIRTIESGDNVLDLNERSCYQKPMYMADDIKLNKTVEILNKWLSTNMTYDWNGTTVVVDYNVVKDWVSIEDNTPQLNQNEIRFYVRRTASASDKNGKTDIEAATKQIVASVFNGEVSEKKVKIASRATE